VDYKTYKEHLVTYLEEFEKMSRGRNLSMQEGEDILAAIQKLEFTVNLCTRRVKSLDG
jgi:hypothetical protein